MYRSTQARVHGSTGGCTKELLIPIQSVFSTEFDVPSGWESLEDINFIVSVVGPSPFIPRSSPVQVRCRHGVNPTFCRSGLTVVVSLASLVSEEDP